jgi:hypothetical protein
MPNAVSSNNLDNDGAKERNPTSAVVGLGHELNTFTSSLGYLK